jgi:DNA-binding CsgD family transcriptional regulator/tetratricopeptide (TPR) repeat protein
MYYLQLAQQAEPALVGPQQAGWLQRLEQEHDNLRAALEWALEQGTDEQAQERRELALRLSTALQLFWVMHGHYSEARTFLERILAGKGGESASLRARTWQATAEFAVMQGNYDRAKVLAQQSLDLCRELEDTRGIANSLYLLAEAAAATCESARALALYEERVRLMRHIGESEEIAHALLSLATELGFQGEYARGQALYDEVLLLFRKAGNELWVGATLVWSAILLFWSAMSDIATVRQRYEQGQALIARVGHRPLMAIACSVEAMITLSEGQVARADKLAQEALMIHQKMGYKRHIPLAHHILGRVAVQRGDLSEAWGHYEESLALGQEMGGKWAIPFNLEGLASVLATQGQLSRAAQLWGAAEAQREAATNPLPTVDRPSYERAVTTVRAQLGEQAFAVAWQEGRSMKLEQVIAESGQMALSAKAPAGQAAIPTAKTLPTYPAGLTAREVEVLRLVAQGMTNEQVAEQIVVSPRTVSTHLTSIYNKLGVNSRSAATRFAVEHQLI